MGAISDFLFGAPSKQKSSSTQTSSSSNASFPYLSSALAPAVGYTTGGGSLMGQLLGVPGAQASAAPAPSPVYPSYPTSGSYNPYNKDIGIINGGNDKRQAYMNDIYGNSNYPAPGPVGQEQPVSAAPNQNAGSALEDFANSAGMNFIRNQGTQAIESSQAGKGMLTSGATGKALSQFGTNLGQTYLNDYLNHLLDYAKLGTTSSAILASAGNNSTSSGTSTGNGTGGKTGLINTIVGATGGNPSLPMMLASL